MRRHASDEIARRWRGAGWRRACGRWRLDDRPLSRSREWRSLTRLFSSNIFSTNQSAGLGPALRRSTMRILCVGGGPSGLYFALLMKQQDPAHQIVVVERNRPYDTFGWGVVFSDQTLGNLQAADPDSAAQILDAFNHWDDIEVNIRGHKFASGGHGFCGIGRKRLLNILQRRCEALGVELVFETDVQDDEQYADADLVIASDGLNSRIRGKYADTYRPDIDTRRCRFVWLGTHKLFEAFTFAFEETEWGWFQVSAYRFDESTSTFVVEAPEKVWRNAGLEQ